MTTKSEKSIRALVPGYVIERTAKRLKRSFQQALAQEDGEITVDQWVLLDYIGKNPGQSQNDIADATAKDKPTVTRILDRLEEKELVERMADDSDRRKFGIYPTTRGKQKRNKLLPIVEQFRLAHYDGLSDGDVSNLLRILEQINHNITASQIQQHALS